MIRGSVSIPIAALFTFVGLSRDLVSDIAEAQDPS